jgi:putative ABC transport system permease protein
MKFFGLIRANLFRKKIRLLLTLGSFAVAMCLFGLLVVIKDAFNQGVDIAGADRLVVINRIGLINPLPLSYRDRIIQIPGVTGVTHQNWFGGVYQDPKNFFPQFVIDPEAQRKMYPEFSIPDDQWQKFLKDRQGAIVGNFTAKLEGGRQNSNTRHVPARHMGIQH